MFLKKLAAALFCAATMVPAFGQTPAPSIRIVLPERTRLLQGQLVDLVIEVRNAATVSGLNVSASGINMSSAFSGATAKLLDCDTSSDWVYRANLQSFNSNVTLTATVTADGKTLTDTRTIQVRPFTAPQRRNLILFIGDAMGTAYRDSIRLVDRAAVDATGKSAFREGFFDTLTEMDRMPVSGMSMTYGTDAVVPDSANTGTAWASGNKTFSGALNVFEDGNDCSWRFTGVTNTTTLPAMLDNPRVENLWQYLKRTQNYRTGIVSTAAITDATPAAEGAYSGYRQARLEVARQYRESPMLAAGTPAFDVILGGGADPFTSAGRADKRDLIGEFQGLGYRVVRNAKELSGISGAAPLLGLFKGSAAPATASNGIATADVNMDVAYDKLGLTRPASEPTPNFGTFTDQPMLDLMTRKAIEVLSATGDNFILMVEAASIDKQSHPNNAAGTIWDAIELDRSVGVARSFAAARERKDTLIVVTADHDQSMIINGVSNTPDAEYFDRTKKVDVTMNTAAGAQGFSVFGDGYANVRAGLPYNNSTNGVAGDTGPGGPPGSFARVNPSLAPETGTLSTYSGLTAYPRGSNGYPVNSGANLRRLAVGYRTGDHTGSSVPVTAEGPGALLFTGYMDQTDIFFKLAASASMDMTEVDKALDVLTKSGGFPTTIGK